MKLAVITNILTPYRVPLFEGLANKCQEFTVLLMAEQEENRQWEIGEVPFRTKVLPGWHVRPTGAEVSVHLNYGVMTYLRQFRPDVVLSGGFAPAHVAAYAYCRLFGKRYVQWGEFTLRDGADSSIIRQRVRRLLIRGSDACVASSTEARDAFLHYAGRHCPILTAPMPVEIERIHWEVLEQLKSRACRGGDRRDDPRTVILAVGRLTDAKGLGVLFSIYERVLAVRSDASLLLVGDGPDREKYEALCRERGWNQVRFVGHVDPTELTRYFAMADVFVFPTLADTFGAVLAEAMAAELPVVSSVHAAATQDLIEEGVTGFAIDPRDAPASAGKILDVLAMSDERRNSLGRAAYERVRSCDIKPTADRMVRFLRTIVYGVRTSGESLAQSFQ